MRSEALWMASIWSSVRTSRGRKGLVMVLHGSWWTSTPPRLDRRPARVDPSLRPEVSPGDGLAMSGCGPGGSGSGSDISARYLSSKDVRGSPRPCGPGGTCGVRRCRWYQPPIRPFSVRNCSTTSAGSRPSTSTMALRLCIVAVSSTPATGANSSASCGLASNTSWRTFSAGR